MEIQKQAKRKVQKEFRQFKRKVIYRYSKTEIWEACSKIHFYSCMKEYFDLNEEIPKCYLNLVLAEPGFLEAAWKVYLKEETCRCDTWEEVSRLLDVMLTGWKLPAVG